MKLHTLLFFTLVPALSLASCGSSEKPADSTTTPAASTSVDAPVDLAAGAKFFAQTCVPCHGATGKGDGAASAALVPPPRDLSDSTWQTSVDDEYLRKVIQYGGVAVGKAATMPANPVLGSQPEALANLVAHIRTLSK